MPLTFNKVTHLPEDLVKPVQSYIDGEAPVPTRKLRLHGTHLGVCQSLPSPLNMKIGDCIGSGRTSFVFEVEPVCLPPSESSIPALVAKFGLPGFGKFLLREAWFYEEMQTLQGQVIPSCYGLYYARIPRGTVAFLPWFRGKFRELWKEDISELDKYINKEEQLLHFVENCAPVKDTQAIALEKGALEFSGNFKEEYAELVRTFEDSAGSHDSDRRDLVVPVLILEKLGKPFLPLGGKNWPVRKPIPEDMKYVALFSEFLIQRLTSTEIANNVCSSDRKEVFEAYEKLSELGITHMDIKYNNILAAPVPASQCEGEHGSHDPDCKRFHKCRIIDFEMSMKSNFSKARLLYGDDSYLQRLMKNLPHGLALGQNE